MLYFAADGKGNVVVSAILSSYVASSITSLLVEKMRRASCSSKFWLLWLWMHKSLINCLIIVKVWKCKSGFHRKRRIGAATVLATWDTIITILLRRSHQKEEMTVCLIARNLIRLSPMGRQDQESFAHTVVTVNQSQNTDVVLSLEGYHTIVLQKRARNRNEVLVKVG